ncbi:hypothetical protein J8L86_15935 [Shewanella sp. MMG014]|uniref:hypothetical protein n=1 Tax=Shewanella sp. MMG014 TaxID=2822691 RepID=UPI001B3950F0|nr:hypothetical protein [Shewanella sp. MMG014]MBQ4891345.1 hypothetical protein [Shewanella sp. MMG014]
MSSKSALKKLKKKSKKLTNKSLKQLNALTANTSKVTLLNPQLKQELNQLSGQVVGNVVSELIQPLNPVLSWFNDSGQPSHIGPVSRVKMPISTAKPAATNAVQIQPRSIAQLPLKTPPCKRCPALAGGNCKCAMKKFNLN